MTDFSTDQFDRPAQLDAALRAARQACATAFDGVVNLLMIDTARLVRRVFPTAAHLVLDLEFWRDRVRVVAILGHDDAELWWEVPDRSAFDEIRDRVETNLTEVCTRALDPIWASCKRQALRGQFEKAGEFHRIPLAAEDLVAATLATDSAPTKALRRRARFYNRNTRHLPAGRDAEFPALRIAGALVFAYLHPDRHVPTLCVSVDLDEVVPELQALPGGAVALEIHVQATPVFLAAPGMTPRLI